MSDLERAKCRLRWDALKDYANTKGVTYYQLLALIRPALGKFQSYDQLTAEQAAWARRRVDEAAETLVKEPECGE